MAQIAIPHKLLPVVATCEAAYADASRKGYAECPDVVAAVADLKLAYKALAIANVNLATAGGIFAMAFATLRAHRASRAVRRACVKIQTTLEQASAEDRLNGRFQTLFGSTYPEINITDSGEAIGLNPEHTIASTLRARIMGPGNNDPARAADTSNQPQSTSDPDTAQASTKPNTEVASPGISDEEVEEEELRRKLGSAGEDAAVRDAYRNLNREDQRLGDEFIRILGLIGTPKDLDRIITLIRINNKNRPASELNRAHK
jgi:hypothetical protein